MPGKNVVRLAELLEATFWIAHSMMREDARRLLQISDARSIIHDPAAIRTEHFELEEMCTRLTSADVQKGEVWTIASHLKHRRICNSATNNPNSS